MRRRLSLAFVALVLSTLVIVITATFGAIYVSSADPVAKVSAEIHRSYLNEIIYNYKNELVSGNYRFFRNQIASLMAQGIFSDYAVVSNGKVVDASENFAERSHQAGSLRISIPVWFDEQRSELWGTVELLVDQTPRVNALVAHGFREIILLVLGVFLLLAGLYLALWNWLYFSLNRGMEAVFAGHSPPEGLAGAFWRPLISKLLRLKRAHDGLAARDREHQKQHAVLELTRQVAHDIRSPVAALRFAATDLTELSEEKRWLLRNAVERIEDIANDLLHKGAPVPKGKRVTMVAGLVEAVVSEKRLRHRDNTGLRLEADIHSAYGLFCDFAPGEIKRALSNIIDNAVEALPGGEGSVLVRVRADDEAVLIEVTDDGLGISAEILPRLGERGLSAGKGGQGSGLGLHQAFGAAAEARGALEISSPIRSGDRPGTRVAFRFPKAPPPAWFAPALELNAQQPAAALDDDQAILSLWRERFAAAGASIATYTSRSQFEAWCLAEGLKEGASLLIDYELGPGQGNGLELIERLHLSGASHLVTSRFEDELVQAECARLGVKIVPKSLAGFVPVRIRQ